MLFEPSRHIDRRTLQPSPGERSPARRLLPQTFNHSWLQLANNDKEPPKTVALVESEIDWFGVCVNHIIAKSYCS